MVTTSTNGLSGPWSRNKRIGAVVWLLAILAGIWFGVSQWQKTRTPPTVKPAASAPAPAASPAAAKAAASAPVAQAPAKPAAKAAASVPVPAAQAPATAPKAAEKPKGSAVAQAPAKPATKLAPRTVERPTRAELPPVVKAPPMKTEKAEPAKAAPTHQPFKWTHVGGDPCNPKVGCTAEWALEQSKWPGSVQSTLIAKVRGESPEIYTMRSGWRGWMTWGKQERKFRADTVAAWSGEERSSLWYTDFAGMRFNLVKVQECGNWGGFTSAPDAPSSPVPSSGRPLGVVPVVTCL